MKSIFLVYSVDDENATEAAFSLHSDADAWAARQENPTNFKIDEIPIDLCVDGYDVYGVTFDTKGQSWMAFKSNVTFEHAPRCYGNNEWWGVCVKAKSEEAALEKAKRLIGYAIEEKNEISDNANSLV